MAKAQPAGSAAGAAGKMEDLSDETRELLVMELNALILLENDAIALYEDVVGFFEDDEDRATPLESFEDDHERHLDDLMDLVERLGGDPLDVDEPSAFGDLTVDRFEEKAEDDGTALLLLKVAERAIRARYAAALRSPLPEEARDVIERALADEERHLAWATEQVDALEVPGREIAA